MMNNNENEILRLKNLIDKLFSSFTEKTQLINELKEKNIKLLTDNELYKQKLKETEEKTEILKTAKTISLSEKDKTAVKEKINKIVRELDKSIGFLNE